MVALVRSQGLRPEREVRVTILDCICGPDVDLSDLHV